MDYEEALENFRGEYLELRSRYHFNEARELMTNFAEEQDMSENELEDELERLAEEEAN